MLYQWLRPFLFGLSPEFSHDLTLQLLKTLGQVKFFSLCSSNAQLAQSPIYCMGLTFAHPVGLAAGLDKNGECLLAWEKCGFSFVEVGTVTPRPQPGNPKPRLFRLPAGAALINRMGFNNKGIDYLISQVKNTKIHCPVGVNIGKNKDTPLNLAHEDYFICYQKIYPYADYVTVNISSPNTPGLQDLQQEAFLKKIIIPLKNEQSKQGDQIGKHVPILVKISPDVESETLKLLLETLIALKVEGIIATNTTIERPAYLFDSCPNVAKEEGGLSGEPLFARSTEMIKTIFQQVGNDLPIIAVGGIMSPAQAKEKLMAGAKLVQLYTGLIYQGPRLVQKIVNELGKK